MLRPSPPHNILLLMVALATLSLLILRCHGETPLEWSTRMARSEMQRLGTRLDAPPKGKQRWDYTTGLYADALIRLSARTGDQTYEKNAEEVIGSFIGPNGEIATYNVKPKDKRPVAPLANTVKPPATSPAPSYSLDNIQAGVPTLKLYGITGEERYHKAADTLRKQLENQPRVQEGGFWHKTGYPRQMWLDGLYMGEPFYADYAVRFNETRDFDDITKQFDLVAKHTFDPATSLFHHGWDETKTQPWANPITGASPSFWSRSIGWYAMGLVDVLNTLPATYAGRQDLVELLGKVAAGVLKYQDAKTGVWWQVTDQGNRPGNYLEASASCMFVYALARGINEGFLPRADIPAVKAGYNGIIHQFITVDADGASISLNQCCAVAILEAKHAGTFDYYTKFTSIVPNDLKGVGPFINAGVECDKLFGNEPFTK